MAESRRTDWPSLVAAVLFLALGVAFVLRGTGQLGVDVLWLLGVLAAGLVAVVITRSLVRMRERK